MSRVDHITNALRELAETALRTAETIGPQLDRAASMVQDDCRSRRHPVLLRQRR